jgi:hypothetical protein
MKNEPAFPIVEKFAPTQYGLTKLEYFAGLAMQSNILRGYYDINNPKQIAKHSIEQAQELIKQLEDAQRTD